MQGHNQLIWNPYNLEGYESAFANGITGRGKGVGVFFKKNALIEVCEKEKYQFIKFSNEKITIFCLYVSKGCDFNLLVQSLNQYDFDNNTENTFLIGDLNFDAHGCNDLSKYLSKLNFIQMVKRATHLGGHILDHVYVKQGRPSRIDIKHHHIYYSDHDGILVDIKKDMASN